MQRLATGWVGSDAGPALPSQAHPAPTLSFSSEFPTIQVFVFLMEFDSSHMLLSLSFKNLSSLFSFNLTISIFLLSKSNILSSICSALLLMLSIVLFISIIKSLSFRISVRFFYIISVFLVKNFCSLILLLISLNCVSEFHFSSLNY